MAAEIAADEPAQFPRERASPKAGDKAKSTVTPVRASVRSTDASLGEPS
jgi:hypothetical protein